MCPSVSSACAGIDHRTGMIATNLPRPDSRLPRPGSVAARALLLQAEPPTTVTVTLAPLTRPALLAAIVCRGGPSCVPACEVKRYMGFTGIVGHEFVGVVQEVVPDVEAGHDWGHLLGKRVVGEINLGAFAAEACWRGRVDESAVPELFRSRAVPAVLCLLAPGPVGVRSTRSRWRRSPPPDAVGPAAVNPEMRRSLPPPREGGLSCLGRVGEGTASIPPARVDRRLCGLPRSEGVPSWRFRMLGQLHGGCVKAESRDASCLVAGTPSSSLPSQATRRRGVEGRDKLALTVGPAYREGGKHTPPNLAWAQI